MSRASADRNRRLRGPPSPAIVAEMSRRRRLGIQRQGERLMVEPARPALLELNEAEFARVGPACRMLLKRDVRKARFAWLWAHSNQQTGAVKECLLRAGWADNRSTSMIGWRLRKDWAIKEAVQEITGDRPSLMIILPAAVETVLRLIQTARRPRDILKACQLVFDACPVLETAPAWEAGERSDAEVAEHVRMLARELVESIWRQTYDAAQTATFATKLGEYLTQRGVGVDGTLR